MVTNTKTNSKADQPTKHFQSQQQTKNQAKKMADVATPLSQLDVLTSTTDDFHKSRYKCVACLEKLPMWLKLLVVTVGSLLGIVLFVTWLIVVNAEQLATTQNRFSFTTQQQSSISDFAIELVNEEQLVMFFMHADASEAQVLAQIAATNSKRTKLKSLESQLSANADPRAITLFKKIDSVTTAQLDYLRTQVTSRDPTILPLDIFSFYFDAADKLFELMYALLSLNTIEPEMLSYAQFLNMLNSFARHISMGYLHAINRNETHTLYVSNFAELKLAKTKWIALYENVSIFIYIA